MIDGEDSMLKNDPSFMGISVRIGFLIGLFFLCLTNTGYALTIVQNLSTPSGRDDDAKPPLDTTLSFEQFNPILENGHLGILDSVYISMTGTVLSDVSLTNTGSSPVTLTANIEGDMYLELAGTDIIYLFDNSWIYTRATNVQPDQTIYRDDLTSSNEDSVTVTGASERALFTGTGLISLRAWSEFLTTTGTSGGSDFITIVSTWAWEDVTVTYNYTDSGSPPVPEPASILLMGIGILVSGLFLNQKNHLGS